MTETALDSIVEVRERIRPEFPSGGLVSLIPTVAITMLAIGVAVGGAMMMNGGSLAPNWMIGQANPFARQQQVPHWNYPFPGMPLHRR